MNLIDRLTILFLWALGAVGVAMMLAAIGLMVRLIVNIFCLGYGC